jgi:hypothetical protein
MNMYNNYMLHVCHNRYFIITTLLRCYDCCYELDWCPVCVLSYAASADQVWCTTHVLIGAVLVTINIGCVANLGEAGKHAVMMQHMRNASESDIMGDQASVFSQAHHPTATMVRHANGLASMELLSDSDDGDGSFPI